MRTATAAELAVLAAAARRNLLRVRVEDPDGNLVDLADLGGEDWLVAARWDEDIDQPVAQATVELWRESGPTESLAPLMEGSGLNRTALGTYAPLLDVGRAAQVEAGVIQPGAAPAPTDYHLLLDGSVRRVAWPKREPGVTLTAQDLGRRLLTTFVEDAIEYGDPAGLAVETVMQQILDDNLGVGAIQLYTPASPGFLITSYTPADVSLMKALQTLAGKIGWELRYRWDEGTSAFRLTLREPGRAKAVPDHTFGPDDYFDVTTLEVDDEDIRNVVTVVYTDAATGKRESVTVQDGGSILRHGRRVMVLEEAGDSPIDTAAEATALANAALSDLAAPKAEQAVQMPFFWPVQLGDLCRFQANGIHYDTDQDLAVTGIRHRMGPDGETTTELLVRGKPAGAYLGWVERARRAQKEAPTVQVSASQAGDIGTITLRVNDPRGRVTGIFFKPHSGAGMPDLTDPADGSWTEDNALPYRASVQIAKKHPSTIGWAVRYLDPAGREAFLQGAEPFDLDEVAEVSSIEVSFADDGSVEVSAIGDEDTKDEPDQASHYVTVGIGSDPADPTAGVNDGAIEGRSGSVTTAVFAEQGQVAHVTVRAVNRAGELGPPQTVRQRNPNVANRLPPTARVTARQTVPAINYDVTITGHTGAGGTSGLQYKWRTYLVSEAPPAYSAYAPLPAGGAVKTISADTGKTTKTFEAIVKDAAGRESEPARAGIPGFLDGITGDGFVDPDKPWGGREDTPGDTIDDAIDGASASFDLDNTPHFDRDNHRIIYPGSGVDIAAREPAEAGADATGSHTSADTANVDGQPAASVRGQAYSPSQNLLGVTAGLEEADAGVVGTQYVVKSTSIETARLQVGDVVSLGARARNTANGNIRLGMVFKDASNAVVSSHFGLEQFTTTTEVQLPPVEGIAIPTGAVTVEFVAERTTSISGTAQFFSRRYMFNRGPVALPFEEPPFRKQRDDQRSLLQVTQANRGSLQFIVTSDLLSAVDEPANGGARITMAAHQLIYGFGSVSYNQTSQVAAYDTTFYCYLDDPDYGGGSRTLGLRTDPEDVIATGRYFVGSIHTPPAGGSSTTGAGDRFI